MTTPLVVAEADHLVAARGGRSALSAFRSDLAVGAYAVEWWPEALATSISVAEQYADLGISLTDASLVSLADRVSTVRIATLDQRHFRAMRPLSGKAAFRILAIDM